MGRGSDGKWRAFREGKLGTRFREKRTGCTYCGVSMWFSDYETIPDYLYRTGQTGQTLDLDALVATLDHVVPLSFFPVDHWRNLVPCCGKCNKDKGALMPEEWFLKRAVAGQPIPLEVQHKIQKTTKNVLRIIHKVKKGKTP